MTLKLNLQRQIGNFTVKTSLHSLFHSKPLLILNNLKRIMVAFFTVICSLEIHSKQFIISFNFLCAYAAKPCQVVIFGKAVLFICQVRLFRVTANKKHCLWPIIVFTRDFNSAFSKFNIFLLLKVF